jgi:hypothetical protein
MQAKHFLFFILVPGSLFGAPPVGAESEGVGIEFFESKVRPLVAEHCYECHSAEKKVKGGLAMDSKAGWAKGGDSGPVLVAGDPAASLVLKAVRHEDAALEMPPKKRLSPEQIGALEQWIRMGAPYPKGGAEGQGVAKRDWAVEAGKHWAFRPPVGSAPPPVGNASWPKNSVDRFILAGLEAKGLRPVAPAGKRELIRRATFDLTGLPPTPDEVRAFLEDASPKAFEKVVERLLASPRYGERWARHWMDVARYAEDQAHTFGVAPNTSGYRYRDWLIGAFNRDMPYDEFVKRQIAGDLLGESSAQMREQIAALGFFGLGAVYYKNSDAAKAAADELDDRIDTLSRGFLGLTVSCARCHDHKFDPIPTQDYYSLAGVFRSSKLFNAPLVEPEEVARHDAAQAVVKDLEKRMQQAAAGARAELLEADMERIPRLVQVAWFQLQQSNPPSAAALEEVARKAGLSETQLRLWTAFLGGKRSAEFSAMQPWSRLGKAPGEKAASPGGLNLETPPGEVVSVSEAIRDNMRAAFSQWKDTCAKDPKGGGLQGAARELNSLFGENGILTWPPEELSKKHPGFGEAKAAWEAAKKNAPQMYPVAHVIAEQKAEDMRVFIRGNPAKTGDIAPRRFLRILAKEEEPAPFIKGSGRLELAEAIASPKNPLTARVIVNRVWQRHFGRGLVGTPSNFGILGEAPTHPELLDYLAVRFVEGGWSIKALHRELMLSATYQLGSTGSEANEQVDGDNRLLWRMKRARLDVESWRDALLSVSGLLDPAVGGPSVALGDAKNRRRSVYAVVSRHELASLLRLFDFPDANISSEKRSETTVPQQQLFVLNSPFMAEQARAFAKRLFEETPSGDDAARLERAFQLAFARSARPEEVDWIVDYLRAPDPKEEQPSNKLSRWERVAHTLLGSNEFLHID